MLGTTLLASIALIHNLPSQHFFWASLRDSSHAWVFFQFNLLLLHLFKDTIRQRPAAIFAITLFAFVTGIVVELVQPAFGRQASLLDAWYDLTGCCAAACWHLRHTLLRRFWATTLATLLLSSSLVQPLIYGLELNQQQQRLPTLISFATPLHRLYWQASSHTHIAIIDAPAAWRDAPEKVAKIDLLGGQYPGIRIGQFHPDWRTYASLHIQVWHAGPAPLPLNLRIHDARHNQQYEDRFNRRITLPPGASEIVIALDEIRRAPNQRKMDLAALQSLGIFIAQPAEPLKFYLGNISLRRTPTQAK